MKARQRFIAEKVGNFGVGLIVGSFLLRISDTVNATDQIVLVALGLVNVILGLILIPDE